MAPQPVSPGQPLPPDLTEVLRTAQDIVVLTGAGMSAESGVPTFREAQSGLWARHDPMRLATPEGFAQDPRLVWDWYRWRRKLIAGCRPNAGHQALARLEARVSRFTLVTQNVDGLHQRAGSRGVLELHGNISRSICSRTRRPIDTEWLARHGEHSPPPSPHHPDGLARPDVVWFGEALDGAVLEGALAAARDCDLMIVVGTSGVVYPAAGIPIHAVEHGASMVEVNPVASELTRCAHWHLEGGAVAWLPILLATLDK